jgi:uncharacterized lipoprotein YmbA
MACGLLCAIVAGCAISHPDHFYALDAGNSQDLEARSAFAMQVSLRVSLPTMVDRSEIVLRNAGAATVFEHERWVAPLSEQFLRVLGQDIEARHPDLIVTSHSVAQPDSPTTIISVDVVELSLQKSLGTRMEARWRVQHGSEVTQGRENFAAPAPDLGFDGVVRSFDACIGSLADRLVAGLP